MELECDASRFDGAATVGAPAGVGASFFRYRRTKSSVMAAARTKATSVSIATT